MSAAAPPPKPWERNQPASTSGAAPGAPKPWETPQTQAEASAANAAGPSNSTLTRPWDSNIAGGVSTSYGTAGVPGAYGASGSMYGGGYNRPGMYGGSGGMYGSGTYGSSGMYGSSTYGGAYGSGSMYGSGGSMYGSGSSMYGSGMYGGGSAYGGGMYGTGSAYGGGMYGGGMYGRPMVGGGMYGGGMHGAGAGGMMGAPPFDPNHPPPAPPSAWQAMLAGVNGVMMFFGRLSFLVDENAHAVHFFISALLQLLDRAGSLYGEVARFILRVIFRRRRALKALPAPLGPGGKPLALPPQAGSGALALPAPARAGVLAAPAGGPWRAPPTPSASLPSGGHWDNLWADDS